MLGWLAAAAASALRRVILLPKHDHRAESKFHLPSLFVWKRARVAADRQPRRLLCGPAEARVALARGPCNADGAEGPSTRGLLAASFVRKVAHLLFILCKTAYVLQERNESSAELRDCLGLFLSKGQKSCEIKSFLGKFSHQRTCP